jgi:hypothetical protein
MDIFDGLIRGTPQFIDIVQTAAIVYVSLLLRNAARAVTRDMRSIIARQASIELRLEKLEAEAQAGLGGRLHGNT